MSQIAVKHTIAADVAPGATFTVPYPAGYEQGDFTGAPSTTQVDMVDYTDLATSPGASNVTITWPADAPSTLKAGTTLLIGLDTVNKAEGRIKDLLPNQADSEAADVAGIVADFNALLAKLKASGLMVDDA